MFPTFQQVQWAVSLLVSSGTVWAAESLPNGDQALAARNERLIRLDLIGSSQVGRHDKIEFAIHVDQVYANPNDPDAVSVSLEMTAPSGTKLGAPAFFYQPFEWRYVVRGDRKAEWIYPTGESDWRVRYAPEEVGDYAAVAVVHDGSGTTRSPLLHFQGLAQESKGYVRVSTRDPRFFEFADGTPYFPIGQNVAFIGESQYLDTERAAEVFRKLSENGANFARVWPCAEDWGMALEARKSAWGRSWSWNPPFAPLPGREGYHADELCVSIGGANPASVAVSPSHPVALRPHTEYVLTGRALTEGEAGLVLELNKTALGEAVRSLKPGEWLNFKRAFTTTSNQWWLSDLTLQSAGTGKIWVAQLSLRAAPGGPELLWEADLQRTARGFYNQLDSYLLDRVVQAAERHGIYLQLCLLTRDHYRHALADPKSAAYQRATDDARKLLRYAVARWGYSKSVAAWEYFNEMDPNAPTERFYRELGQYLEQADLYHHLRTTSAWAPAPSYWAHPQLDIADLHWYLRPAWGKLWQDEVAAVLDRSQLVRGRAPRKPALLAEFGLADNAWGRSPYMTQDKEGVHFHNALWASAFSGLSGTAMFWWWETLDQQNAYPHYRPLAAYLADIPFTTAHLQPVSLTTTRSQCRVLAWRGRDRAYCWISNPQATWWNLVAEKKSPDRVAGDAFALGDLENGTYQVQWWDTHQGKVIGEKSVVAQEPGLTISIPPFVTDIACRLLKQPGAR